MIGCIFDGFGYLASISIDDDCDLVRRAEYCLVDKSKAS